jgi:hypothetical protein
MRAAREYASCRRIRQYLARTYAKKICKASVTGYCIKFKALKDVDIAMLGVAATNGE